MKAKALGVFAVLIVLVGGILFYRQATGPQLPAGTAGENNGAVPSGSTSNNADALPPAGSDLQAEASIVSSDLISAAANESATFSVDEENFLLDDAGDLDAMSQAITVE
ncbi:MAG: hypothetical protein AAB343_03810 [Patescibacteria group bacterium]